MNNIKDLYLEKLDKIQKYLDFAIEVSNKTAGINVNAQLQRTHQLYIKLTVTCMSFIRLLPHNNFFPSPNHFWDIASITSIARNFIEAYHTFYYIGIDPIDESEAMLRLAVFRYHIYNEEYQIHKYFGKTDDDLIYYIEGTKKEKEFIENHSTFLSFSNQYKKEILSGKKCLCLTHNQISERIPFNTTEFKAVYKFFSNHTHSTPLSFYPGTQERGTGVENEEEVGFATMAIEFVIKYLIASILDLISLFPDCENRLNKQKLEIIKNDWPSYRDNTD